ncbi:glutathione peroxidase [Metabacillus bambusae]|uniref:Glutathione peroxidase n=1 Tax=Metabacillus bambusae TaxID=2795218 RepID=A0ABS3NBG6_9BACI|nr:glutathione peroxidase [Metabacillus bambusae]MBO1515626.1 glutathione peroxidase [Metabacillus bambusae]
MSIYQFEVDTIKGEKRTLKQFENKVLLIVNTASNCGFTPQYKELQELYEEFGDQDFTVLGFPCNQFMGQEPGNNSDIENFCEVNYGVSFPMFSKIDVNGEKAHPLFVYLASHAPGLLGSKAIKWNFTKFLVNNKGEVVKRFSPNTNPSEIKPDIEDLLKEVRV